MKCDHSFFIEISSACFYSIHDLQRHIILCVIVQFFVPCFVSFCFAFFLHTALLHYNRICFVMSSLSHFLDALPHSHSHSHLSRLVSFRVCPFIHILLSFASHISYRILLTLNCLETICLYFVTLNFHPF